MHKLTLNFIYCLLVIVLAACQDATPSPTPPPDPETPPATQPAVINPRTPDPGPSPTPTPTPTPPPDSGTLLLWHSWSGNDGEALAQLLGSFQAAYPDIQIETLFVAYNRLPQAYADAVFAGGGPDLILAPSWWLQELAEVEALLPLDDLIDPTLLDAYWPAAVENMRYGDHLYGLPTTLELVTLYYNRDLIDEADLPTTTNAMLALAQANPQQGAGLYANFYHLYWGIGAYGGALFDAEGRVILDETAGAAEFLTWLVEMNNTAGVYVDLDYGMLIDRFKKGEFAFFVDGPWSIEELRNSLGDAIGNAPLPAGSAGAAKPWLNADGVFLNPISSPHQQQLALRMAQHLTTAQSGTVLATVARRVPAQIDAQVTDPLLLGFTEQAQVAIPEPHRPEMVEVWGYTGDMVLKVLGGVLTPEEAVIEATTLINEANNK
ncbi:MAG: extracellular solute-binding protein [Caldilineaceae bacterium]|nr:extracellular solute-binding protein [Caldilineaceae bacterium]